jgi:transcriptional regulator with XRE-family HTH domain
MGFIVASTGRTYVNIMTSQARDHFGTRLLRALEKANVSQAELARHCNVSRTAVSKWVRGSVPTVDMALLISDRLDVSIRWLVAGGLLSEREIQLSELERQLIGYVRLLKSQEALGVLAHAKGIAPENAKPAQLAPHLSGAAARRLSLVWPPPTPPKRVRRV